MVDFMSNSNIHYPLVDPSRITDATVDYANSRFNQIRHQELSAEYEAVHGKQGGSDQVIGSAASYGAEVEITAAQPEITESVTPNQ